MTKTKRVASVAIYAQSAWRAYFTDIDTGEELAELTWTGTSEGGIFPVRNVRFTNTALTVWGFDWETRTERGITAADFPGRRVQVKVWHPSHPAEYRYLVDRAKGWKGNEAANAETGRALLTPKAR